MIYVLNLTADLTTADGFFLQDPNRYWLKQDVNNPGQYIPANGTIAASSADTWNPTLNQSQGDQMQLGVFFKNSSGVTSAELSNVKFYLVFSRRRASGTPRRVATPFFSDDLPQTMQGGDLTPLVGNESPTAIGLWVLLPVPNIPSGGGVGTLKFEFSVVAVVTYKNKTHSYSYDPELDVDVMS